jgi:hypothetical protein
MIKATILKNGCLKITADNAGRHELAQCNYFDKIEVHIAEELHRDNFEFIRPEWVGALTDSPILTNDLSIGDTGVAEFVGDVWWFPNYMITDPWQELKNKGKVIFIPEENNTTLHKRHFANYLKREKKDK